MSEQSQTGQFIKADFFDNVGGLNITDSPFRVKDNQATGGYNYSYSLAGGISKRGGHAKLNSVANTSTRTIGYTQYLGPSNIKYIIRSADRKIQLQSLSDATTTNLSLDTLAAGTDFWGSAPQSIVQATPFNTSTNTITWLWGGSGNNFYGVYSSTKATANGVVPPTGTISVTAGSSGGTLATGTYYYAITSRKASTQVLGNAVADASVAVMLGQKVTVDLTGLTIDTTRMDKIYIYRSAVSGASGFTTGDLVAIVASTVTSYLDGGGVDPTTGATVVNVPRPGATVDNGTPVIPSAMTAFKRRLVIASGTVIHLSDLNKPESWPLGNTITVPGTGNITGLVNLSYTTPSSSGIDEILCIFTESELFILTGTGPSDWALKFIANIGCPYQQLIAKANGYILWVNYRGFYMWDGSGKPIYISRPIEQLFQTDGDLDKTKFGTGWVAFYEKQQTVCWVLSSILKGEQCLTVNLDMRWTMPLLASGIGQKSIDGTFILDYSLIPLYAGASFVTANNEEVFYSGDASGNTYSLFSGFNDNATSPDFFYDTRYLDMGTRGIAKRFHKVIVWLQRTTNASLTLDFWTDYTSGTTVNSATQQIVSNSVSVSNWDQGFWDACFWDDTFPAYEARVFNLSSTSSGNEGDAIKLRFSNSTASAPVVIAGFSVIYTQIGLRK